MGRAPCCDKANVKKGPWSPEEDAKLKAFIEEHGTGGNWIALPQKIGLRRCGKSCRLRWLNYLRPNIKHGGFSEEEDNIICSLYISIGSRWSIIAAQLPGRTDNDIKNYWNTRLKKKLLGKQRKEQQSRRISGIKQELKKGAGGNIMFSENGNRTPYFPELPAPISVPYPNQDPHINDQAAIRKLLIKLGGRFSNDHHQANDDGSNLQPPSDISSAQYLYANSINLVTSTSMTNYFNGACSSLLNNQYNVVNATGTHMLQGPSSFPIELDQMVYKAEGFDWFNEVGIVSSSSVINSVESIAWGDSSLVYPPILTNYEAYEQGMPQESVYNDSKYVVSQ